MSERIVAGCAFAGVVLLSGCAQRADSAKMVIANSSLNRAEHHSWMRSNTTSEPLLYVSGACGGICVFSYPGGTLVGELSDPNSPEGECVDASGNVFVANYGYNATPGVYEYAHGGTSPIAELSDPGYYPLGCSIDSTTGNLAVTGAASAFNDIGAVAIYTNAQGVPTDYADEKLPFLRMCSYDDKGDLFVDGFSNTTSFSLAELPVGASSFRNIKLSQQPSNPASIQWTGRYLSMAATSDVIYHVSVSGSHGEVGASTLLDGIRSSYGEFWIQGRTLIMSYETTAQTYAIGLWKYPAGGRIRKVITNTLAEGQAYGVVVSPPANEKRPQH